MIGLAFRFTTACVFLLTLVNAVSAQTSQPILPCGPTTPARTDCTLAPEDPHPTQITFSERATQHLEDRLRAIANPGLIDRTWSALTRLAAEARGRKAPESELALFLQNNKPFVIKGPAPVVLEADDQRIRTVGFYVLDQHEFVLAAGRVGKSTIESLPVHVLADVSNYSVEQFWIWMAKQGFVSTTNSDGETLHFNRIPIPLSELRSDPFLTVAMLASSPALRSRRCFDRLPRVLETVFTDSGSSTPKRSPVVGSLGASGGEATAFPRDRKLDSRFQEFLNAANAATATPMRQKLNQNRLWANFFRTQVMRYSPNLLDARIENSNLDALFNYSLGWCNAVDACSLPGFRRDFHSVCIANRK